MVHAGLSVGEPADCVSIDGSHPALLERQADAILDSCIFAARQTTDCVWVGGIKRVSHGVHELRPRSTSRFRQAVSALADVR